MYGEEGSQNLWSSYVPRRQIVELGGVAAVGLAMPTGGEAMGQVLPKGLRQSRSPEQGPVDL